MHETVHEVLPDWLCQARGTITWGAALTQIAEQREIKFLRNEDSGFGIVKKTHYAELRQRAKE